MLCCKMKQTPANSNDATTGHKLQGISKDVIIVLSWPIRGLSKMFKNLEYVLLSHVRTLSGLYLVEPLDMEQSVLYLSNVRYFPILTMVMENAHAKESFGANNSMQSGNPSTLMLTQGTAAASS